jgi:hypothetical protein
MIWPTHDADGQPDYAHMSIWVICCDLCPADALIGDAEDWHQGQLNSDPAYCPACVTAIAKRLIDSALPRRRKPLGLAVVALIAVGVLALRPTKGA